MKHKHGNVKPKATKNPVFKSNVSVSNGSRLNVENQTGLVDLVYSNFHSRMETEAPRAETNMSGWQADPNSLRQLVKSIIDDLSKGITDKPSRGFASSSISPISDASLLQPQSNRTRKEDSRVLHQDPRYKEQELKAALSVIKKIMKLGAAKPFNIPVDPIALAIPDYFDIIDTPMDFGTICKNIENGLKYMNSKDVYKDVQYIWDNCCKYNKKGNPILELMDLVRKNFMKHWTAAGLYPDQQQPIDDIAAPVPQSRPSLPRPSIRKADMNTSVAGTRGNLTLQPPTKSYPMSIKRKYPVTDKISPSPVQPDLLSSFYSQPLSSSHQPSPSLEHEDVDSDEESLSPPTESTLRRNNNGKECQVPVTNKSIHYQQDKGHQPQSSPQPYQASLIHILETTNLQKRGAGCGPTPCLQLLKEVGRVVVATNGLGEPIGNEAPKLTSFIGMLARDGYLAPLTYANWSKVPDQSKEYMWQKVQSKFEIDPIGKGWVMKSLADRWRKFKAFLKANHYDTHATDEERLADRDERVLPDQWSTLIQQWSSEECQNMSAQNKANQAKRKLYHTTGTKSFARILEEERTKRPDRKELSWAELFIMTHTRKNGEALNDETAAVISKLRERTAEQQESPETNAIHQDDIFCHVMGENKKGRKRLYGLGSPSDFGAQKPTLADAMRMVSKSNADVNEMKEKMVSIEKACAQMATQMATMLSVMASMQKTTPDKLVSHPAADTNDASEGLPKETVHTSPSPSPVPTQQAADTNDTSEGLLKQSVHTSPFPSSVSTRQLRPRKK